MSTPENRPTPTPLQIDPIHERFRVGRYYICKLLGEGNFSKVWSVVTREGGLYAMKIVDRHYRGHNMDNRISFEIEVMERLEGPHVITYREMLVSSKHVYIVTDFYKYSDLAWMISLHHRLSLFRSRMYFQHLILGVQRIHHHRLAHRDIKPGNLMIDNDGRVRISDFGLAGYPEKDGLFYTWCGTPAFKAPEIVRCIPYDGFAADVWACGCVLYNMLAGIPPFIEELESDMEERILAARFHTLPAEVDDETEAFIRLMLRPDPERRITIEGILTHPWFLVNFGRTRPAPPVEEDPIERFRLVQRRGGRNGIGRTDQPPLPSLHRTQSEWPLFPSSPGA